MKTTKYTPKMLKIVEDFFTDSEWLAMVPLARVGWLAFVVVVSLVGYAVALFLFGLRPRHLRNQGSTL